MKIHGIMVVKDEADVIQSCLEDLCTWIDDVFIIDNGSLDGTWEIILELAKRHSQIVAWKQDFRPFKRSMRAEIFAEFRHLANTGDWWYIADSDEFLIDNPKTFLASVPKSDHVVFKKSVDYYITKEVLKTYEFTGNFALDREHITYIAPSCWAEIRFFRHRNGLKWNIDAEKPDHMGVWYTEPILLRHYQYRSPLQIQKRLNIRNSIPKDKMGRPFRHVVAKVWDEDLPSQVDLLCDSGNELYSLLPLRKKIVEPIHARLIKRIAFALRIYP